MKEASYYRKLINDNYYYELTKKAIIQELERICEKTVIDWKKNKRHESKVHIDVFSYLRNIVVNGKLLLDIIIKYELDKDFIIDMIRSELISNGYGNVYVSIINWNSPETELHTIFEF